MKALNIGLLGYGTVGSGVGEVLWKRRTLLERRAGVPIKVKWVCAQSLAKGAKPYQGEQTPDPEKVVSDPDISIIVELFGGIEPARSLILEAFRRGKHVVTANKALLAEKGPELFKAAQKAGVLLGYEASVAGSIPIIKVIRESLVANRFESVLGILNGTSNYILTQMAEARVDFNVALTDAQANGFAEKDPTLDIGGFDAAHKLALLARLGYGYPVRFKQVYVEGIQNISQTDIQYADLLGYCIKPLALAKRDGSELELRVHPTLLPKEHLLSDVNGVYNAIHTETDFAGSQLFSGKGAGRMPTASSVVGDIVDVARSVVSGAAAHDGFYQLDSDDITGVRAMGEVESRYYLRFMVLDKPGVMAQIAGFLGRNGISISSVNQKERQTQKKVPVVMMTHDAVEANINKALKALRRLNVVDSHPVVIRVEEPKVE